MKSDRSIITKEPWWANPPKAGQSEKDLEWGYLVHYSDGAFEFLTDTRPTDDEIDNRKGCRNYET